MKRKILELFLCAFCLAALCTTAFASESGTFGEDVVWTLSNAGTLTISGSGYVGSLTFTKANVKHVTIGSGITAIGYTLSGCENLQSASLPQSLTSIGNSAFYGCGKLSDINIPQSLVSIGDSAFRDCVSLPDITLPNSLRTIGADAFENCDSYDAVYLPDSITGIGSYAFAYCDNLVKAVLPNGIETLGTYVFRDCPLLEEVTLPGSVGSLTDTGMFYGSPNLKKVVIQDGLTTLGDLFNNQVRLVKVVFPRSIVTIQSWCRGLPQSGLSASQLPRRGSL